ncbi:Pet100p [Sporobolomyces koalae]|uniref:Pet100p n=1 Tax=Sporobolomyces koalae TaxID=500713 RepID=UPI00316CD823
MAPAQLELFKFSLYVFFPVCAMLHYGDPDWYEKYVGPLRASYRQDNTPQIEPPQTSTELKDELARLRAERLAKKQQQPLPPPAGVDLQDKRI